MRRFTDRVSFSFPPRGSLVRLEKRASRYGRSGRIAERSGQEAGLRMTWAGAGRPVRSCFRDEVHRRAGVRGRDDRGRELPLLHELLAAFG